MYPYKVQRIGLFGGSFNPPHKAHIALANYAIKELKLDLLIFIPTYKSIGKESLKHFDGQDRKQMLDIARSKKKTIISDFELQLNKSVQSIETIKYFKRKFNEVKLFFFIGDDHLETLHTWSELDNIFKLVTIVVFKRLEKLPKINFSTDLFNKLYFLNNKIYSHSSSAFRNSLDWNLLNKKIEKYIKLNQLH